MPVIDIGLQAAHGNEEAFRYRVAETDLLINVPVRVLSDYAYDGASVNKPRLAWAVDNNPENGEMLYEGPGWIGNAWRDVSCRGSETGFRLAISGIGRYWIAKGGNHIVQTEAFPGVGTDVVVEATLGPALIMALALHHIWSFHASAVLFEGQAVAFMGESGKGKSTLASWLGNEQRKCWRQIGDDILPVSCDAGEVHVLPHFPQLKLAPDQQPSSGLPERLPLAAIYVLDRPTDGKEIALKDLGVQEGALALVRHTVAARLFDANMMARHLDVCVQIAERIPVCKLIYPHLPGALQKTHEALLERIRPARVFSVT